MNDITEQALMRSCDKIEKLESEIASLREQLAISEANFELIKESLDKTHAELKAIYDTSFKEKLQAAQEEGAERMFACLAELDGAVSVTLCEGKETEKKIGLPSKELAMQVFRERQASKPKDTKK